MVGLPGILELAPIDDLRGFLIVIAAFLVQVSVWGVRASLSAFTHAIDRDPKFCDCFDTHPYNASSANATAELNDIYKCCDKNNLVATAVGIAGGLGPLFGVAAGYLSGRFGARPLILSSAVCCAASLLLSTVANSSITFLLAYGPLMGIASGFMVTPGAFAVGTRFEKWLPLAMGILYGGGGLGSALIPRLAGGMLSNMGGDEWRDVQRYISIFTVLCLVMAVFVRERRLSLQGPAPPSPPSIHAADYSSLSSSPPEQSGVINETPEKQQEENGDAENLTLLKSLILSRKYLIALFCAVLYGYSYYSGLFCLIPYARAHGDPTSEHYHQYTEIDLDEASNMMLFFGLSQCVGSILLGFISTKLNYYLMNLICAVGSAGVLAAIPSCHTFATIGSMAGLLGLFSAGCRMCYPSMITNMFIGPCLGSLIGLTLMGYGIGALPGPPLSSQITNLSAGNYSIAMYIMSGCVGMYGLISYFALQRFVDSSEELDEREGLVNSQKCIDRRGDDGASVLSETSQLRDF